MNPLMRCGKIIALFSDRSSSSSSSSVICQTTGPKSLPKWLLHIVRTSASSFNWQYTPLFLRSSSSFLRPLPRLLVTSICPFIFPSLRLLQYNIFYDSSFQISDSGWYRFRNLLNMRLVQQPQTPHECKDNQKRIRMRQFVRYNKTVEAPTESYWRFR